MKILVLLPLLFIVSCNDQIGARTIASNIEYPESPTPKGNSNSPDIPAPKILHPRCQSTNRCLYAQMPIYQQGHSGLESYIGNKIGVANYQDAGICVPTSAAMILRAVVAEKDPATRLNNSFLENLHLNSWYDTVYQIGVDSSTDFINGGTYYDNVLTSFQEYFHHTVAKKDLFISSLGSGSDLASFTNLDIINLIKTYKTAFLIGTDARRRREAQINGVKKIWYEIGDASHSLVIKGFDGDRLHIQDPWGMDHFARIHKESFANYAQGSIQPNIVFTDFSNSPSYFMGYYGSTHKIVLHDLIGLSLD